MGRGLTVRRAASTWQAFLRPQRQADRWEHILAAISPLAIIRLASPAAASAQLPSAQCRSMLEVPQLRTCPLSTPNVAALTPSSGPVGTVVLIAGSYFGALLGTSTVAFNGTAATPTLWSNTSITVPVPIGAKTGAVVVTVGGAASSGVTCTVGAGKISGTITQSGNGSVVSGASIKAYQLVCCPGNTFT